MEQGWVYLAEQGMPYDDYWHGSPHLTILWRKAISERQMRKAEETNFYLHHLGGYIYNAVSSALAEAMWCAGGGKGEKPDGYIPYVIPITEREAEADLERKKKETLAWVQKGQR